MTEGAVTVAAKAEEERAEAAMVAEVMVVAKVEEAKAVAMVAVARAAATAAVARVAARWRRGRRR